MTRRTRKPGKRIPNAGIVERAMADAKWMRALTEAHEATARALERGRTVGRLEALIDAIDANIPHGRVVLTRNDFATLLPILRAEIARLDALRKP